MKPHLFKSLFFLFLILSLSACNQEEQNVGRPNIVWITSEDNSKHYMKLWDENGVETPNIANLAQNGILFNRAFSNTPVCSAARSALITGSYGPRIGANFHRRQKLVPLPDGVKMFPTYLRESGYYTTNNSKEDYNLIKPDGVWDESSKTASWKNRTPDQPFFHVRNIAITHEGSLHFTEEQMRTSELETDQESFYVHPVHPQTALFKYTNALYRDKIKAMDKKVGEIVDELREEGLLENTFIFYFGDHGGVLPGSKGYLYETGLHIPLVVYVPEQYKHLVDVEKGSNTDAFVSFIDFAPTVLNLAGVEIPKGMDGHAFLGIDSKNKSFENQDETYSYADRHDEKYDMVRSVRKGNYKYLRNYQPFNFDALMNNYRYRQLAYQEWLTLYEKGELNTAQSAFFEPKAAEMLFDLENDPFETNDLSSNPDYAAILKEMRRKLNDWVSDMPDLAFYPEHFLVKNAFDNPVLFGQEHKKDIKNYIETANLSILEYDEAKVKIRESLVSNDPWQRYWGLIVCSNFGSTAEDQISIAKQIARSDIEKINRVRAAEFLGLINAENPTSVMTKALYDTDDNTEALLILNSIVLMQDGSNKYEFNIDLSQISEEVKDHRVVGQRLKYLGVL
jgi:arylsulfatase A-like enzyme